MADFEVKIDKAKRLLARLKRFQDDSPEMQQALFFIGNMISNEAKRNVVRTGAVDTGILRGAIGFRVERSPGLSRVVVGAFGIKYARMVEFGGVMTKRQLAAMFASFRKRGRKRRPGKGIIRNGYYRARPYLHPAFEANEGNVVQIIATLASDKGR